MLESVSSRHPDRSLVMRPFDDEPWDYTPTIPPPPIARRVERDVIDRFEQSAAHIYDQSMDFTRELQNSPNLRTSAAARTVVDTHPSTILPMYEARGVGTGEGTGASQCLHAHDAAVQCASDRVFTDRRGKRYKVFLSCMPHAQKDYGVGNFDETLRNKSGLHSDDRVHKREVSNDDLPLNPDRVRYDRDVEAMQRTQAASSILTNASHMRFTSEVDWQRDDMYDGLNMKHGNETRAQHLPETRRASLPQMTLYGSSDVHTKAQLVTGLAAKKARAPLGAPQTTGQNSHFSTDRRVRSLVVLREATPASLPNEAPMGVALTGKHVMSNRGALFARGPTRRADVQASKHTDLSAAVEVTSEGVRSKHVAPLRTMRDKRRKDGDIDNSTVNVVAEARGRDAVRVPGKHDAVPNTDRDRALGVEIEQPRIHGEQMLGVTDSTTCPDDETIRHAELYNVPVHGKVQLHTHDAATRNVKDANVAATDAEADAVRGLVLLHTRDDTERYDRRVDGSRLDPKWKGSKTEMVTHAEDGTYSNDPTVQAAQVLHTVSRTTHIRLDADTPNNERVDNGSHNGLEHESLARREARDMIAPEGGMHDTDRTRLYETVSLHAPRVVVAQTRGADERDGTARGEEDYMSRYAPRAQRFVQPSPAVVSGHECDSTRGV